MRFLLKSGILFPCLLGLLAGIVAAQQPAPGIHQTMDRLVVITFSVPIVGVLLVFSFLLVPAAIAFQFTRRGRLLAIISWIAGVTAFALGIAVSFHYDLPTGPVVACGFGLLLFLGYLLRRARPGGMVAG